MDNVKNHQGEQEFEIITPMPEELCILLVNRLNEDNHISRENSTEAKHETSGAMEARVWRHPHTV